MFGAGRGEAAQRPVVEQQEHERQCHQHGFGHQAQGKQDDHSQVTCGGARLADIADIGREREHAEHAAEDILALRNPCDGFDAQRMDGKDRSHEGTAPQGGSHPP